MDNFNYPVGADNSDAPWNDNNEKMKEARDVTVYYDIHKCTSVRTNDYSEEYEKDEDGSVTKHIDWSHTDFEKAYHMDLNLYTLPSLLERLSEIATKNIEDLFNDRTVDGAEALRKIRDWQCIKRSCEGWIVDDITVLPEGND